MEIEWRGEEAGDTDVSSIVRLIANSAISTSDGPSGHILFRSGFGHVLGLV